MILLFSSIFPDSIYAGTIHTVGGSVRTSWGGIPAVGSLTFRAYITIRPSEVLTQSSANCDYWADGYFRVQCATFPTNWSAGEICRIEFQDQDSGETGSVEVTLTNNESDNVGRVTLSGGVEAVTVPATPSGPASGYVQQSLSFSTSGSSCNYSHPVEYQFDFGDGVQSSWTSSGTASHSFANSGTFQVKARARCQVNNLVISGWSASRSVTISFLSLTTSVSPADAGNVTRDPEKTNYVYNESVNLSAVPVNARYRFNNWSGDLTGTANPASINMTGNKTITANFIKETVSAPNLPTGPTSGMVQQSLNFNVAGSSSSFGHPIEYRFNWADGSYSNWGSGSASHVYAAAGTYSIRAQTRCQTHTDIVSGWSPGLTVTISAYSLTVSINPSAAGNIARDPNKQEYNPNETVQLTATPVDESYRFDHWSGDLSGSINPQNIVMDKSKSVTAHFEVETISRPVIVSAPASAYTGQQVTFSCSEAVSSFGHNIYYRFNWGDATTSAWGSGVQTHTYQSKGNYNICAQARCIQHGAIVSEWSEIVSISINSLQLSISIDPVNSGTVLKNPDKSEYTFDENVKLTAQGSAIYLFDHWSGDADGNVATVQLVMNENKDVTAHFRMIEEVVSRPNAPVGPATGIMGEKIDFDVTSASSNLGHTIAYQYAWGDGTNSEWGNGRQSHTYDRQGIIFVSARARCTEHPDVVSDWSDSLQIMIDGYHLTVLINPTDAGNVTVTPDKEAYTSGDSVSLVATPEPFFEFDSWSGDESGSNDTLQIIMDSDKQITADFTRIPEMVLPPQKPEAPDHGIMGEQISFMASGASSNLGHEVEYQFDWGNGEMSDWGEGGRVYSYLQVGEWSVSARARCKEHKGVQSAWSDSHRIVIDGYYLDITVEPQDAGTVDVSPQKQSYISGEIVELIAVPDSGFVFNSWSGDDTVATTDTIRIVMDQNRTILAIFKPDIEVVTTPEMIYGVSKAFRGQAVIFSAEGARSSKNHTVEYQFDWGDGILSAWGSEPSQSKQNLTVFSSPTGGSGLPNSGRLIDFETGVSTDIRLYITGGNYSFDEHGAIGSDLNPGTDAYELFNHAVDVHGVLYGHENGDEPLLLTFTNLDSLKRYDIAFSANLGESGWDRISIITLQDAEFFINESSYGTDDEGRPLYSGEGDATTILPAGNSDYGYVACFNRIDPGFDARITFRIDGLDKKTGLSCAGFVNALLLREMDYRENKIILSAYNDLAWHDTVCTCQYGHDGIYGVRARARCIDHPEIMSDWTESSEITITGCELKTFLVPENNQCVIKRDPDLSDYDYNDRVRLQVVEGVNFRFLHWNDDPADTAITKLIYINSDTIFTAQFNIIADVVQEDNFTPVTYQLYQNFPNPFNPVTRIEYDLPHDCSVNFTIYNSLGQKIKCLIDRDQDKGHYSITWDAADESGINVQSGIYFGVLRTEDYRKIIKITLLK